MLKTLTPEEAAVLRPGLERVTLAAGAVLAWPGEPPAYIYFPEEALISLLAVVGGGKAVDAGLVGREGLVGLPVFLGGGTGSTRAVCQLAGTAWRLRPARFLEAVAASAPLRVRLLRYTEAVLAQAMQLAGCNGVHPPDRRCARWLLMVHDRVAADSFGLSHTFLAQMLGTRRPSVTAALGRLRRGGVIDYTRGQLTVRDRAQLAVASCPCYGVIRGEFDRLLPGSFAGPAAAA